MLWQLPSAIAIHYVTASGFASLQMPQDDGSLPDRHTRCAWAALQESQRKMLQI